MCRACARSRSRCIAAARRQPDRGPAAGSTSRRRTACSRTSSSTTPSPVCCGTGSRPSRPGRWSCATRSSPTPRTHCPARTNGAAPATDPPDRASMNDQQTAFSGDERPPYLIAAACWFLIGERWIRAWVPARLPRRLAAVAGALVAATAFTVWNQSVVNEKVYTVSLLSIALVLWLIVRWDDQPPGEAHDHHLLLIVYLLALTATNHMMGVLVGPVVLILLFPPLKAQRPPDLASRRVEWSQFCVFGAVYAIIAALGLERSEPLVLAALLFAAALVYAVVYARNWDFALAVLAVALIGLSVYLFLPIRAVHFPPINEGEPTTRQALWEVLTRQQYGKPPVWQRQATLVAQIFMWVQYFTWQWGRDLSAGLQHALAVVFGALGVLGAWRHWKADFRTAFAMTALVGTLTLLLIFYLNFKYGYSQMLDHPQLAREVRERDYFFIASFALWGVWVGMGLATLMEWITDWLEEREPIGD